MAKSMARIKDGVVVNIEWCDDEKPVSDSLVETEDRPVSIGDTYDGGCFWHEGEMVLSEVEELRIANEILMNGLEVEV